MEPCGIDGSPENESQQYWLGLHAKMKAQVEVEHLSKVATELDKVHQILTGGSGDKSSGAASGSGDKEVAQVGIKRSNAFCDSPASGSVASGSGASGSGDHKWYDENGEEVKWTLFGIKCGGKPKDRLEEVKASGRVDLCG